MATCRRKVLQPMQMRILDASAVPLVTEYVNFKVGKYLEYYDIKL